MIANRWYCIAQTGTFDSGCSITVSFGSNEIQFSASVRYGMSAINITRCQLSSSISVSVRLRESGNQWSVDMLSTSDIQPSIVISDSPYWSLVNSVAGAGNIILTLNDISSKYNTESGGGTGGLDEDKLREFLRDNGYTALLDFWKLDEANNAVYSTYKVYSNGTMAFSGWDEDDGDGGGGTVIGGVVTIKLGDVEYESINGTVYLPAYPTVPTRLSDFENDSKFINEQKFNDALTTIISKDKEQDERLDDIESRFIYEPEYNAMRIPMNLIVDGTIAMGDLGNGGGETETVAGSLVDLDDVVISSPSNGDALVYNEETQKWENKPIDSGLDEAALEEYLEKKNYATEQYVNDKDREQFSSLQSNTTTPVAITVGGVTKTIEQSKMRSSLGLGTAAYESKDTFATKKALDETDAEVDTQAATIERLTTALQQAAATIADLQQRLRSVEDWGFQFTMTPQGSRVLVTPHNFVSEGAISFAGLANDEEFEQKIVLITQEGYDELVANGQVNETKIYYVY